MITFYLPHILTWPCSHLFLFLTHFMPLASFYTPWKHQKNRGIVMISGYIKRRVVWNGSEFSHLYNSMEIIVYYKYTVGANANFHRCSTEYLFAKVLQNSQENNSDWDVSLVKLQGYLRLQLYSKMSPLQVFIL